MARPSTLPAGNTGHAFWANLTHAWTFHATGNTGGADADDIPGTLDATLSGAVLSDTLGLDCDPETDRATISTLTLLGSAGYSIMLRAKLDAANTESMAIGDATAGTGYFWLNNGGTVRFNTNGISVDFASGSGTTTLTDYCVTVSAGATSTVKLYTKAASGTDWAEIAGSSTISAADLIINSLGAAFNSNTLWLQGELEYAMTFNAVLTESNLDTDFADPYSILVAAGGGTTGGMPFGTRGRAFNGGRPFAGAMR